MPGGNSNGIALVRCNHVIVSFTLLGKFTAKPMEV